MPQNSNFRLPRCHRFRPKSDLTVMAPNHGGDTLGSIVGPMGSHLVQKMGENRQKLPCPKIRIFDYPRSSILAKIRPYGYGAKSRWGPPSVHLGANGSKKMGENRKRLPCPKIQPYGYGVNSRWGPPRVHFGANGVPLGPKQWVKTVKKIPCPKIRIFDYPAVIDFGQNPTLLLWRQFMVGTPRVHFGANGVPLCPKNGSKPWKITMPQNSNFRLPRGHRFRPKSDLTVMAPNHGGDPLGSILGPIGTPNLGENSKKLSCLKIRIFDYPAVIHFGQNPTLWLWRQFTVGTL